MKVKITLFIIMIILAVNSCTKVSDDYRSVGTITGQDLALCACCGGWIIYIDDVRYLFDKIPDDSKFSLKDEVFPVKVRLDWQLVSGGCPTNRITIQRIKKE
jgi:hypothetical protein